ncbi:MAG: ankyrin repeat domain-containing protein [Pirellulales bacterium]
MTADPSGDHPPVDPIILAHAHQAFASDDAADLARLLEQHPELKTRLNDPSGDFDSPPIVHVRSRAMLDVLLAAGADIDGRSQWWAGGFGLLDSAPPEVAKYALERGATLTVHAAARLALIDELRAFLADQPSLVHLRGGDGQTALHFAATIEVAEILLDAEADIDARDVDHESTPAQHMLGSRTEIAQFLVRRGCHVDLLMSAALGDRPLAERLLQADPECIRLRVSDECFPMVGGRCGGTIYQWTLGWYVSAVQVAKRFGHHALAAWLEERSPPEEKLLNACWLHDAETVLGLLAAQPDLATSLPASGRQHLAHAARNNDTEAARLMLQAGLPVDGVSQHRATPLHWAAWQGNAELVRLVLERRPDLENRSNDYSGSPLDWALHGSENGWDRARGNYPETVSLLLAAGAQRPAIISGSAAVQAVLHQHGAA